MTRGKDVLRRGIEAISQQEPLVGALLYSGETESLATKKKEHQDFVTDEVLMFSYLKHT